MSKLTLSVSKVYKNGNNHKHHCAKKHWRRYYFDTYDEKFGAEYVSGIKAMKLKLNIWKRRKAYCFECQNIFDAYIKNDNDQVECPYCY